MQTVEAKDCVLAGVAFFEYSHRRSTQIMYIRMATNKCRLWASYNQLMYRHGLW